MKAKNRLNFFSLLLILQMLSIPSKITTAQESNLNRSYTTLISASCKDGVGMIYTYQDLDFVKDSVKISYRIVESLVDKSHGSYVGMYDHLAHFCRWTLISDTIILDNCTDLTKLILQDESLVDITTTAKPIVYKPKN